VSTIEDCKADCTKQKYVLKAIHADFLSKTSFKIMDDGIVTTMRLFYKNIVLPNKYGKTYNIGNVFAGVKFKDHESRTLQAEREHFQRESTDVEFSSVSIATSDSCGIETDTFSEWISVGGPIKGSFAITYKPVILDAIQDYISNFGVYVEDPCQAIDNNRKITLTPGYLTSRDLKYHEGTNSTFWLRTVC